MNFLNASIFSHPQPALAAWDLELEVAHVAAGLAGRGGKAQRGAERMTKSTGGRRGKDWAGLSF